MKRAIGFAVSILTSAAVWAQTTPQVFPVPIPGGDVIPPPLNSPINQFTPGVGAGFDGENAEPNGITNFDGMIAMGYTLGTATDSTGTPYQVITDVRVYQGDYLGAVATFGLGGTTTSTKKVRGTFVEI